MNNPKRETNLNEYMLLEKALTKAIWHRRLKAVFSILEFVAWFSSIFIVDALNNTGVIGMVGAIACTILWLVCGALGGLYILGNKHLVEE